MLYTVKSLLFRVFGLEIYLKCLHVGFHMYYKLGGLKSDYIYKYHYFVNKIIKDGDTVIDIGANLGFYTQIFLNLVGDKGKVICVEPIPNHFKVLKWAFGSSSNCTIHHCAIGNENKTIQMAIPNDKEIYRSGLAKVKTEDSSFENEVLIDIEMKRGSELFASLDKIDYIKCDIEGYESIVIPELKPILEKYFPIVQIETFGDARPIVETFMDSIGFVRYSLYKGKLIKEFDDSVEFGDLLYVHPTKMHKIQQYI